jgi:hypothetical protein
MKDHLFVLYMGLIIPYWEYRKAVEEDFFYANVLER